MAAPNARGLGLAAGGLAFLVAVGAAVFGGPGAPPAEIAAPAPEAAPAITAPPTTAPAPPETAAPAMGRVDLPAAPEPRAGAAAPGVEIASLDGPTAPAAGRPASPDPEMEFLVAFKPQHPMAKAQALAAEAKTSEAEALARRLLRTRSDLAGLCLVGFTMGGSEVVLAPCEAVPAGKEAKYARQWLAHLRRQAAIAYADQNVVLQPGAAPRPTP